MPVGQSNPADTVNLTVQVLQESLVICSVSVNV